MFTRTQDAVAEFKFFLSPHTGPRLSLPPEGERLEAPPSIRSVSYVVGSVWRDESNRRERVRRLFMAGGWQVWKRVVRTPIIIPLFNGFRFRAYPDCQSSSAVFYTRIPNFRCLSFLRRHIEKGTLLDIGANVGLVSLLLADKIQHAVLFEPNPIAAARARENLALNHLNYEVHELALSDQAGTVEIENAGGVDSCNRTVVGFTTSVPTISVPRNTLDRFLAGHPHPVPVSAVKIDVEGHENSVLRGMSDLLASHRPRLVMFEYLQRINLAETMELFSRVGYRVMELKAGVAVWATPRVSPLQDLFACPEEMAGDFIPTDCRQST
jgi:FkbM family methyltransferase